MPPGVGPQRQIRSHWPRGRLVRSRLHCSATDDTRPLGAPAPGAAAPRSAPPSRPPSSSSRRRRSRSRRLPMCTATCLVRPATTAVKSINHAPPLARTRSRRRPGASARRLLCAPGAPLENGRILFPRACAWAQGHGALFCRPAPQCTTCHTHLDGTRRRHSWSRLLLGNHAPGCQPPHRRSAHLDRPTRKPRTVRLGAAPSRDQPPRPRAVAEAHGRVSP